MKRQHYLIIIDPEAKARIERGLCPMCALPKQEWKRRTDWRCCSTKCTDEFEKSKITRSWAEVRMKAFQRDSYTCQKCGLIPTKEMAPRLSDPTEFRRHIELYPTSYPILTWKGDTAVIHDTSQLIGDHIIPIALGGPEFDLTNVQTLCKACNKVKTKQDAQNIAVHRSVQKNGKGG